MSASQHNRGGSWLSLVLGYPQPPQYPSSPEPSDSESHNSHRSTAAELPPLLDAPTYSESAVQTESESLQNFIGRVTQARKLLRDAVEISEEPRIPKRVKLQPFTHVYQTPLVKSSPVSVRPFDPRVEPISRLTNPKPSENPSNSKQEKPTFVAGQERPQESTVSPQSEEAKSVPANSPQIAPLSPPRIPQAPAPSPQSSSTSSPSLTFTRDKTVNFNVPQPQTVQPTPPASSFFVKATSNAADEFFEDPGFVGGEDDSEDEEQEGQGEETVSEVPANSNPFFSSGKSMFDNKPGSLFGKPAVGDGKEKAGNQSFGGSLFGPSSTPVTFGSGSLFNTGPSQQPGFPGGSGLFNTAGNAFLKPKTAQTTTEGSEPKPVSAAESTQGLFGGGGTFSGSQKSAVPVVLNPPIFTFNSTGGNATSLFISSPTVFGSTPSAFGQGAPSLLQGSFKVPGSELDKEGKSASQKKEDAQETHVPEI